MQSGHVCCVYQDTGILSVPPAGLGWWQQFGLEDMMCRILVRCPSKRHKPSLGTGMVQWDTKKTAEISEHSFVDAMMKAYYASNNHNQHDCNMMETGFVLAYVLWVSRVRCHPHAFHGRGMLPRSLTYPLLVFQLVWCVNLLLLLLGGVSTIFMH